MRTQTPITNVRRQAGVLPYRFTADGIEVLLITARGGSDRWIVPKGNIEIGDEYRLSDIQRRCAAREAWEEAGILGVTSEQVIGIYEYYKGGRKRRVQLFAMRVREQANHWPEMHERERLWVSIDEVAGYLDASDLIDAFEQLQAMLAASYRLSDIQTAA